MGSLGESFWTLGQRLGKKGEGKKRKDSARLGKGKTIWREK
jgi:hypothetical protein